MAARAEIKGSAKLDATGWDTGLARMKQGAASFASSAVGRFTGITAIIAGIASAMTHVFTIMRESAQQERTARSLGISAGMVEELGDAVKATGADAQGFNAKLVKMVDSQESAILGNKELTATFNRLGISAQELTQLTPDQLLVRVAQGAQTSATAISDLNNIMGRGAAVEYSAILQDIASKGLPAVDALTQKTVTGTALMARGWEMLKEKASDALRAIAYGIANIGTFGKFGKSVEDQIAAQEKARAEMEKQRLAGLKIERDAMLKQERDKIAAKFTEKEADLASKRNRAIQNITVGQAQGDSLARIGGFQGGQLSPLAGVVERVAKAAEINAEFAKEQAELTKEMNQKLTKMSEG